MVTAQPDLLAEEKWATKKHSDSSFIAESLLQKADETIRHKW